MATLKIGQSRRFAVEQLSNGDRWAVTHYAGKGWETFTDAVIDQLNQNKRHLVFILWGRKHRKRRQN